MSSAPSGRRKDGAGKVWIAKDGSINISVLADAEPDNGPGDDDKGENTWADVA